jgi:hypothetical protein
MSSDAIAALISLIVLLLLVQNGNHPDGKFRSSDLNLLLVALDNGAASLGMVFISENNVRSLPLRRVEMMLPRIDPIRYIDKTEKARDIMDAQPAILLNSDSLMMMLLFVLRGLT